jgi:2-hydroxychromene-2-carboxylate isomerase
VAQPRTITAYIDYESPYAYLAKDPAYELAARRCSSWLSRVCPEVLTRA